MKNKLKLVVELIKDMHSDWCRKLELWNETLATENEVMKLSNWAFLDAFKQVGTELSEITGIPYLEYLNKAKEMLLQGISKQDVMYHFDCIWYDLMFGKGGVE